MADQRTAQRPAEVDRAQAGDAAGVSSYSHSTTERRGKQGFSADGPVGAIKSRLDLVEIIGRDIQLRKSGQRWVGLCPFHPDKNPSFTVFPDGGWRCFGCSVGGDVFDYVMQRRGWNFRTALRELANEASVELGPLTPEQRQAEAERRGYEAALGLAADHFAQRLRDTSAALGYARGRAWTEDALAAEHVGYADGSPLPSLGHDRAQAVAGALKCWAGAQGGTIVYVHRDAGRVVYFSCRAVAQKAHYNPPSNLAGPKRPHVNSCYSSRASELAIVEGPACAITLAGWDVPALALCGTAPTGDLAARLKQHAERGAILYLVPDADGRTDVNGIVDAVGPLLAIVRLPDGVADANAYAQGGATAEDFQALLDRAPAWLDLQIEAAAEAQGQARDRAVEALFPLLAGLPPVTLARYRGLVTRTLSIKTRDFDTLLKAARGADDAPARSEVLEGTFPVISPALDFLDDLAIVNVPFLARTGGALDMPRT